MSIRGGTSLCFESIKKGDHSNLQSPMFNNNYDAEYSPVAIESSDSFQ